MNIGLRVVRAVAGVVVVQGFDAVFVGSQQVFEHLFHRNFVTFEFARVVSSVGGNRLIDEFLHYADKFQVAFVARKLPQGFVGIFQGFKLRHDLFQNAVFRCFDRYQSARRLDAVGCVGDLRAGFRRHERGQSRVAHTVFDDVGTQAFPVVMQRLAADGIKSFVGVDGQFALRINGLVKERARSVFFGKVCRCFEQVILYGFKGTVGQTERGAVAVADTVFAR